MLFVTPIGMAAPIYFGWLYDTTGSYMTGFTLMAALLIPAAVVACFILPPKPPAPTNDIHKFM